MARNSLLAIAIILIVLLTILGSFAVLPAAPIAPTATWPLGVEIPNKLHRITQP